MERCNCNNSSKLVTDNATGEIFCADCGYVLSERIEEQRAEWRAFSKEEHEDRSRTGIPTSLAMHDMGLATVIGQDKDYTGKPLSTAIRSTIERLRTWDSRSKKHKTSLRNLSIAMLELDKLKDKLAINDNIIERTAYIYRKALERKLVRGRRITAMAAAALYAACRETETPRTLKDIANASNIKKKDIARCYSLLIRELGLQIPAVDPIKYVSKIANKVGLTERTKRTAIDMLKRAKEVGIEIEITAGKNPMVLAAAVLYLACVMYGEKKTQEDIAEAAGVTAVAIRNRYKSLREFIMQTKTITAPTTPVTTPTTTTPTTVPSTASTTDTATDTSTALTTSY